MIEERKVTTGSIASGLYVRTRDMPSKFVFTYSVQREIIGEGGLGCYLHPLT